MAGRPHFGGSNFLRRFKTFLDPNIPGEVSFCHATVAWRDILLSATVTRFQNPQYPRVSLFLKSFLFCHAAVVWQDMSFLQAAANFLQNP
jgi:hypothetical protein